MQLKSVKYKEYNNLLQITQYNGNISQQYEV